MRYSNICRLMSQERIHRARGSKADNPSPTKERDPKRRLGYYHDFDRPQCLIAKQFSLQPDLGHVLDITALLVTKTVFDDIQVIVVGEVGVPSNVP